MNSSVGTVGPSITRDLRPQRCLRIRCLIACRARSPAHRIRPRIRCFADAVYPLNVLLLCDTRASAHYGGKVACLADPSLPSYKSIRCGSRVFAPRRGLVARMHVTVQHLGVPRRLSVCQNVVTTGAFCTCRATEPGTAGNEGHGKQGGDQQQEDDHERPPKVTTASTPRGPGAARAGLRFQQGRHATRESKGRRQQKATREQAGRRRAGKKSTKQGEKQSASGQPRQVPTASKPRGPRPATRVKLRFQREAQAGRGRAARGSEERQGGQSKRRGGNAASRQDRGKQSRQTGLLKTDIRLARVSTEQDSMT